MQYAVLGRTGLKVSRLGFGCMRLPMHDERVNRDLAIPLLREAVALGINLFDTAVGYCNYDSQVVIGEALHDLRPRLILSTKNNYYNKKDERGWWKNLEDSLKRMRTDYLDIYNFHGLRWDRFEQEVAGPDGMMRWMLRARDQGLVRHIGFSFHDTAENLKKLASTGLFETVILQYNLLDRSNEPAFAHVAGKCGMGIIVMGPVGGGRLGCDSEEIRTMLTGARSVPEVALRFVLSNPHVTTALSGMSTMEQLRENAAIASRAIPLSESERRRVKVLLHRFKKLADLYCTGCNYCMPCPAGVNIPGNFSALNYYRVYGLKDHAKNTYARLGGGQAAYCLACGRCMPKCPQHIDVVRQLRETVRTLDDAYGSVLARLVPTTVTKFRASQGRWQATVSAKVDFVNLRDEPADVSAAFTPPAEGAIKPQALRVRLKEFGRKTVHLTLDCRGTDGEAIEVGGALAGVTRAEFAGARVYVAFAARAQRASKRGVRVPAIVPPIILGRTEQLARGTARDLAHHGAICRFAYDQRALYLDAKVKDDCRAPASRKRGHWAADRLTLWLDARPPQRLGRNCLEAGVFQIHFLAPGDDEAPLVHIARPRGTDVQMVACRSRRVQDGYHVRAEIPWKLLGQDRPLPHLGLGLSLTSHPAGRKTSPAPAREPNVEMHWTGPKAGSRPDLFGHLFLA